MLELSSFFFCNFFWNWFCDSIPFFFSNFFCAGFYHYAPALNSEVQKNRVSLYDKEVKRQSSLITDIEKIRVHYQGTSESCFLMMNKELSTPATCAQRKFDFIAVSYS